MKEQLAVLNLVDDSPFFSAVSATTRPWNKRVEVAITVSPGSAFSWLPIHKLQPGRSKYRMFSYLVRAAPFGLVSSNSKPAYFLRISQSPSALSSSTMLYVGGATTNGALNSIVPFCFSSYVTFER